MANDDLYEVEMSTWFLRPSLAFTFLVITSLVILYDESFWHELRGRTEAKEFGLTLEIDPNITKTVRNNEQGVARRKASGTDVVEMEYQADDCANGHRLTSDPNLVHMCEGLRNFAFKKIGEEYLIYDKDDKRSRNLYKKDEAVNLHDGDYNRTSNTCGGISLDYGSCVHFRNGTYKSIERPRVQSSVIRSNSSSSSNSSSGETPPVEDRRPLCSSTAQIFQKGFKFQKTGYANPKSAFAPANCSLIPDRQGLISEFLMSGEERLRKARFLLVGDSHLRNLFTGMIAGVRNLEFAFEGHPTNSIKERGAVYNFRIWQEEGEEGAAGIIKDDLEVIYGGDDEPNPGQTLLHEVNSECEGLHRCIIVAFIWAPRKPDQISSIPLFRKIKPNIFITGLGVYPSGTYPTPDWIEPISDSLLGIPQLQTVVFYHWPYGRQVWEKKSKMIDDFFNTLSDRTQERPLPLQTHYVSIGPLNQAAQMYGENGLQLKNTWHSICSLHYSFPEPRWKVKAFEPCTALIDKSYARILATLYLSDFRRGKAAAAGATQHEGVPKATKRVIVCNPTACVDSEVPLH